MIAKGNQNIFDFTLQEFGTLENLFDDVLVPNSLNADSEIKQDQEININALGKGNDDVKMKISEQGLSMTNGDIPIIVEYRNGIVTNAIFGDTAVFDFEAKINSSTPVVFTVNWGADVGISTIESVLVNGVWKALQTTILIPEGVDANQTINVTDNLGGSYSVDYIVEATKILITMDMSTPSTAGINLTFASGSLSIDWKEGGGLVPFVSGVELTHLYTTPGTYIAEISGDRENITKFVADNSKITFIENLKTGLLTDFQIWNNLYVGVLNMLQAPISGAFYAYGNSGLTEIAHAVSGNALTTIYRADNCNIIGQHDLSNVPVSGTLWINNNTNFTGFNFATSGNGQLNSLRVNSSGIISLNLSNNPLTGILWANSCPSLTSITFASSGNGKLTDIRLYGSDITGTLDFSNMPVSGLLWCNSNSSMTGATFATTGNTLVTFFDFSNCNISTLDLTNVPVGTSFRMNGNSSFSSVTFAAAGNGSLSDFNVAGCNLPNTDFSVFPNSDGVTITYINNSLTSTEHDNQLINLDATGWINGSLLIIGGNTARTAASDTAYNNLITNGWSIT